MNFFDVRVNFPPDLAYSTPLKRSCIWTLNFVSMIKTKVRLRTRTLETLNKLKPAKGVGESGNKLKIHNELNNSCFPLEQNSLRNVRPSLVFGPWTGELGMELLYWAPWVNSISQPGDLIISRGGVNFLYPKIEKYLDIFSFTDNKWWKNYQQSQMKIYGGEKQRSWLTSEYDLINKMIDSEIIPPNVKILHPKEYFRQVYDLPVFDSVNLTKYILELRTNLAVMLQNENEELIETNFSSKTLRSERVAFGVYSRQGVGDNEIQEFLDSEEFKESTRGKFLYSMKTNFSDVHHSHSGNVSGLSFPLINSNRQSNLLQQARLVYNCETLITTHGGLAYLGLILGRNVICFQGKSRDWNERHISNAKFIANLNAVKFKITQV